MSILSFLNKFRAAEPPNAFSKILPAIFVFVFAAVFVPFASPLFLFLLPMILFLNGILNGIMKTSSVFFFSFSLLLVLAVFLRVDVPAIAVFTMGMTGIFMAQFARKNFSITKTIIYSALFIIAAVSFYFGYDAAISGTHPWHLVKNFIAATVKESVKFYSQMPLKAEDISLIKDNETNIITGFVQMFPSIVITLSVLIVWINFLLGNDYLQKAGMVYPQYAALSHWKVADGIVWVFILSGALFFIPRSDIHFISINLFFIICFIYLLQGLAIVSFLFQRKNVPAIFRYFFYFFIAVQQLLMIPIIAIGLFDIWIDFRKLIQKNQTAD